MRCGSTCSNRPTVWTRLPNGPRRGESGDPAVAAALVLARRLGIQARFAELVQKELGIGKKAFARIDRDAESLLAKTDSAHSS